MQSEKLTVSATVAGTEHRGQVVELSPEAGGAKITVMFESGFPSTLIGEEVALSAIGSKREPFAGRVVYQSPAEGGVRCQFIIDPEAQMYLQPALSGRKLVRVRPAASEPVWVSVAAKEVVLYDISVGGAAILVPQEDQGDIPQTSTIQLLVKLPDEDEPFEITGTVLHRRLSGTAVVYGIQFDEQATASFPGKEDRIHKYVMKRQHDVLSEKRGRAG